jgi:peroxiredoxin
MLQVGTKAPDFTLAGSHGTTVTLSKRASPYAVLVFYPKNNTPG